MRKGIPNKTSLPGMPKSSLLTLSRTTSRLDSEDIRGPGRRRGLRHSVLAMPTDRRGSFPRSNPALPRVLGGVLPPPG